MAESIRNDYNHLCGATIGDRAIRNAGARFVVQIANRRHIHVLGYRIKRGAGQVEIYGVKRLVEENDRIAFEIMKARFAGMQIADRRRLPVLPIFTTWVVAKLEPDEVRIFAWNGFAPSTIGMIGSPSPPRRRPAVPVIDVRLS